MVGATMDKVDKTYKMFNEVTKVTIESNEKFMPLWLARGFKVVEIHLGEPRDEAKDSKDVEDQ